jgi:hypothetical protein
MGIDAPRFRVVVYREVDRDGCAADADVVVLAESAIQAASLVLCSIGGGYADYVGVSAADAAAIQTDGNGFLEETCYMYCNYSAGEFSYDVRL